LLKWPGFGRIYKVCRKNIKKVAVYYLWRRKDTEADGREAAGGSISTGLS
jgi:hypothetical protein